MSSHQSALAAAYKVLDLVLECKMELAHLDKKAAETKQLMEVQAAMMGEAEEDTYQNILTETSWSLCLARYVQYMFIKFQIL